MSSALLDAQRIVAADSGPRDAGRAEVVERDRPACRVAGEQLGAGHTGELQVLSEEHRAVLVIGEPKETALVLARRATSLGVQPLEQRPERSFDGDASSLAALRGFDLARLAVERPCDVDHTVLEVDVTRFERDELAGPHIGVDSDRVHDAKRDIDAGALD